MKRKPSSSRPVRSWIERIDASDSAAVREAIERWANMIRAGWMLTIRHHYRPTPELIALGYLPDDPIPRPEFGYPPRTAPQLRLPI